MWFSSDMAKREFGVALRPAKLALNDAMVWYLANGYAKTTAST